MLSAQVAISGADLIISFSIAGHHKTRIDSWMSTDMINRDAKGVVSALNR